MNYIHKVHTSLLISVQDKYQYLRKECIQIGNSKGILPHGIHITDWNKTLHILWSNQHIFRKKKSKNFDAQSGMVEESLFCSKIIILFLHLELQLFFCCQRVYVFIKIHTRLKCSVLILYITLDCISPSDSDVCKQGHNKFNS